jgi:autotransporter-associated beta strand protein
VTWDAGGSAPAAPTDGSGNWNTTTDANWTDGTFDAAWVTGNTATIGANNGPAGTITINDGSGTVSAAGINFNAAGSGNYVVAATGGDTLTLTAPTITVAAGASPIISAPIVGTSGLTVAGTGTLTLSGANSYSGNTVVTSATTSGPTGSTLILNSGGTLGAPTNTLTLGTAGALLTDTWPLTMNFNTGATLGGLIANANTFVTAMTISSGQTVTDNGAATFGLASATSSVITVLNTYTGTDVPGSGGELDVNGNVTVGLPNTTAKDASTVDLSALSKFTMKSTSSGTLNVGNGQNIKGVLTLASGAGSTNIINVTTINDGVSGSSTANAGCVISLGSGTNTIETGAINIGTGRSSGVMQFVSGAPATASVNISGVNGEGAADITIGSQTSGTATNNTSLLLLAGKSATVAARNVTVAASAGNTGGTALGTMTFDKGTFNISTLKIGIVTIGNGTAGATGTVTVGSNAASTGTMNITNAFILASNTNPAATPGTAAGTFTMNGGFVNVNTNIASTGTKGVSSGTLNLNGGVLDLMGNYIGGSVANGGDGPITVNLANAATNVATLKDLGGAGINNAGLNMNGLGTLVLAGTNTYSGSTSVGSGTLLIGNAGALPSSTAATITGGTLKLGMSTGLATLSSLAISGAGTFDVTNNHVILNYGSGPDPIGSIMSMLNAGYDNGAWDGAGGVTSSAVASNPGYSIGYADSADAGNPANLASGTLEVAFTLVGDVNLDHTVNGVDFGILAANFNKGITGWDKGDFNYDNSVNGVDFGDLAANFNKGAANASDVAALDAFAAANGLFADVPEPASGGLMVAAGAGILRRRRRRNLAEVPPKREIVSK